MKQLPAPYGYGDGVHVSLRGQDSDRLTAVLTRYSCYPPAIPKIRSCLAHSGRYDCVLQRNWFRAQYRDVVRDLARVGVHLSILSGLTVPPF